MNSTVAGIGVASGDYEVVYTCYTDDTNGTMIADSVPVHINIESGTWNVVGGGSTPPGGAVTTSTTLAADPTSATQGDNVKLTATVAGDGAAGQVEFDNGTTSIATVDVANGQAVKTVNDLAVGDNSITAKFTPTDSTAFTASASDPVNVTVSAKSGGGGPEGPGGNEIIRVTVPGDGGSSDFAVTVDPTTVNLAVSGSTATGQLSPVTVTDSRSDTPGWSVSGQAADFKSGTQTLSATNLGWAPAINGGTNGATQGAEVAPGDTGLSAPASLASAPAGSGAGSTKLGAALTLSIPTAQAPGNYVSTLTVTTVSAAVS